MTKRISILLLSSLLSACAAAPREVAPSNAPAATTSPAASTSTGGIAVGHDRAATNAPAAPQGGAVKWTPPATWKVGPERQMRSATYLIPAASGDAEGAECAVFENIGGGVQANIDRWIGQFEQPDGSQSAAKAKQKKETVNGFAVTTVDLVGTFKGGGPMMGQSSGPKPNYRLLGAIVETPGGEVFFKMTGPSKTMTAAEKDFQALLKSIK